MSDLRPAPQKFRKKPVVIEAMQYTGTNFAEIESFVAGATKVQEYTSDDPVESELRIHTLEDRDDTDHWASIGDFIIKGVKGEFYPCKPDIFAQTYESAATPAPPPSAAGGAQKRVLLDIGDGPEGLTIFTDEEQGVVDWASSFPPMYVTVAVNGASAKFGPFTQSKQLLAQLSEAEARLASQASTITGLREALEAAVEMLREVPCHCWPGSTCGTHAVIGKAERALAAIPAAPAGTEPKGGEEDADAAQIVTAKIYWSLVRTFGVSESLLNDNAWGMMREHISDALAASDSSARAAEERLAEKVKEAQAYYDRAVIAERSAAQRKGEMKAARAEAAALKKALRDLELCSSCSYQNESELARLSALAVEKEKK